MRTILGYVADAIAEGASSDEHATELWEEVRAELHAAGAHDVDGLVDDAAALYRS